MSVGCLFAIAIVKKNYTLVGIRRHVLYYACYSHEQVAEVRMLRKIDSIMDNDVHLLHALKVLVRARSARQRDIKVFPASRH